MGSRTNSKILLSLLLKNESDVMLVRRRARQIAHLLGFNSHDQTRVSTAVSEIVRNALVHAKDGRVDFCISDAIVPIRFVIDVSDKGPGIQKDSDPDSPEQIGLKSAKQLVDKMDIITSGDGTTVRLEKNLTLRTLPFSPQEIDQIANSLTKLVAANPLDELHQQNQELLVALDLLSKSRTMLDDLNVELKQKNDDLTAVYAEMQRLNAQLEEKVKVRTAELEFARDEAIVANALKSQFVANISHEIRTPMSGILGLTELLVQETEGEQRETANYILNSATALMVLVNDLLDLSKLESGKLDIITEPFNVEVLVQEVTTAFNVMASQKHLTLTHNVEKNLPQTVLGAVNRVRQVLQNLVQNAIKFTERGGVDVNVKVLRRDDRLTYLKFTVRDTGPGISEIDQKKLFQLFVQVDGTTTRRHGGTGLGLALSKKLVEMMSGSIGVDSEVGAGSSFWFIIPVQEKVGT